MQKTQVPTRGRIALGVVFVAVVVAVWPQGVTQEDREAGEQKLAELAEDFSSGQVPGLEEMPGVVPVTTSPPDTTSGAEQSSTTQSPTTTQTTGVEAVLVGIEAERVIGFLKAWHERDPSLTVEGLRQRLGEGEFASEDLLTTVIDLGWYDTDSTLVFTIDVDPSAVSSFVAGDGTLWTEAKVTLITDLGDGSPPSEVESVLTNPWKLMNGQWRAIPEYDQSG